MNRREWLTCLLGTVGLLIVAWVALYPQRPQPMEAPPASAPAQATWVGPAADGDLVIHNSAGPFVVGGVATSTMANASTSGIVIAEARTLDGVIEAGTVTGTLTLKDGMFVLEPVEQEKPVPTRSWVTLTDGQRAMWEGPKTLTIGPLGKPLVTIYLKDGRVELAEGYTSEMAAREFWRKVEQTFPCPAPARKE